MIVRVVVVQVKPVNSGKSKAFMLALAFALAFALAVVSFANLEDGAVGSVVYLGAANFTTISVRIKAFAFATIKAALVSFAFTFAIEAVFTFAATFTFEAVLAFATTFTFEADFAFSFTFALAFVPVSVGVVVLIDVANTIVPVSVC